MARRRHTPEQIIRKLREADRLLGEGADATDVARHLEISEQTYHRWRNQFGGMKADDAKRLRELEREGPAMALRCQALVLGRFDLRGSCHVAGTVILWNGGPHRRRSQYPV
jgi:putative transposase